MYRGRLKRDLALWVGQGIMPAEAAEAALREFDARPQSFTVGRVLVMLAAVLLAAAILLFIASNWDGLDRWLRVALLIGAVWGFHGLASFTAARGSGYLPGLFLILGTASFGASIALIGQMFHLSGDGLSAAFLWFAMTAASTLLFRSGALTYVSGILALFQFGVMTTESVGLASNFWFYVPLVQAVLVIAFSYYTGAMRARHLAYALLFAWIGWIYIDRQLPVTGPEIAVLGLVLFLLAALPVSPLHRVARNAGPAPAFYAFALTLMGLFLYQVDRGDFFGSGVANLADSWPAIASAAFAVLAIALEGRDNGAIRYCGYAVFALEILYLSMEVVGSILGTSGLFLGAGLILAAVGWLVIRLERRFAALHAHKGA